MAQVITRDNMQEFIESGKVAEYVPPDAKAERPAIPGVPSEPTKPAEPAEEPLEPGDDEYTENVRKRIGKEVYRRRQAEAAAKDAEDFAKGIYQERTLAESRAEQLARENADLKAKLAPPAEAEPTGKKPDIKQFTNAEGQVDWDRYTDAKAAHAAAEAVAEDRKKRAEEAAAEQARRAEEAYRARLRESAKAFPDFEAVTAEVAGREDEPMLGPAVKQFILESDSPAPLLYHFAKHPEVVAELNAMSPIKAIAKLTKLESTLVKSVEKPNGSATAEPVVAAAGPRAPAPIEPIAGGGVPVHKDPSTMTVKELREYEAARKKQSTGRVRH